MITTPAFVTYQHYLNSPQWRTRREAALRRADHACQLNATHTERLRVHHRTYERIGFELESDLMVLCDDCHARHHGILPPELAPASPVPIPSTPREVKAPREVKGWRMRREGRYEALLYRPETADGKQRSLGVFGSPEEAVAARKAALAVTTRAPRRRRRASRVTPLPSRPRLPLHPYNEGRVAA